MSLLTEKALNRAVLARQGLLEPADGALPAVVLEIGGIQAQHAPSMYVGLWSRMRVFAWADLDAALERRTVVQGTLQRATIHLVHRRDWWPVALAVRERRRLQGQRALKEPPQEEMRAHVATVTEALRAGPMYRKGVEALVGKPATRLLHVYLDIVRVPPTASWRRPRADRWALAEEWIGPPDSDPPTGLVALVDSYLRGFGPATRLEIARYAGLNVTEIDRALDALALRHFEAEDGSVLLDLPRAPLPDPDTPAPVRLLPTWDQTLIGHKRRAAVIAEADRGRIFSNRYPRSYPVFLIDGQAAGTWSIEEGHITVQPWRPLDPRDRRALGAEVARLEASLP